MMSIALRVFAVSLLLCPAGSPAQDPAATALSPAPACTAMPTPQRADSDLIWQALDNGDVEQAGYWFAQMPESAQQSVAGQIIAARILAASNSKAAARQLVQLAEAYPDNADIMSQLGVISVNRAQQASMFSALGHAKDALKYWQQALDIEPQHRRSLQSLAMYHLAAPGIAGGDKDQAVALAEQLLVLDAPAALALQAQIRYASEQPEAAMQTLDKALLEYPQAANLYFVRARWQADAGQWEQAWQNLQQACQHADSMYLRRSVQYQLGRNAVLAESHLQAGIEALLAVQAADDQRYRGWTQLRLAQLYRLNGELPLAQQLLEQVDADSDDKNLRKQRKAFAALLEQAVRQQTALLQTAD